MIRRIVEIVCFAIVMVALVVGITSLSPEALQRVTRVLPPQDNKSVCIPAEGNGTAFAADAQNVGLLGRVPDPVTGPVQLTEQDQPVVLTGSGSPVGGYLNIVGPARSWTPCVPPLSQGMLLVPTTANTELRLVNSDSGEAVVDLTLLGADGEVQALGARGIAVAAGAERTIAVSVLTEQPGPVAVSFQATRGRVTMIARTNSTAGLDATTAQAPAATHLLPGVAADAGNATVLLANPSTERAEVEIQTLGASASYTPEGGSGVEIPARSTLAVPLATALSGEASAFAITADVAIGATLVTGPQALEPDGPLATEQAFVAPAEAAEQLVAYAPAGGVLQLSSQGPEVSVQVELTDVATGQRAADTLTIPAGATATLPLPTGSTEGQLVTVTAPEAVFGAIAYQDGSAAMVIPLKPSGAVTPEPLDAELDPTLH